MCDLSSLKALGIMTAVFATVVELSTVGFYAWKAYEVDHDCEGSISPHNTSDVCFYDELELRTYVGLGEGILGTIVAVCLIVAFAVVNLPLVWIYAVWAAAITGYNAYCIYDYYIEIDTMMLEEEYGGNGFDWSGFLDVPYSYFFLAALISTCCHALILLIIVPTAIALMNMFTSGVAASFSLGHNTWKNNDGIELQYK